MSWWVKYKVTGHGDWFIYQGPFDTNNQAKIEARDIGGFVGVHSVYITNKPPAQTALFN